MYRICSKVYFSLIKSRLKRQKKKKDINELLFETVKLFITARIEICMNALSIPEEEEKNLHYMNKDWSGFYFSELTLTTAALSRMCGKPPLKCF